MKHNLSNIILLCLVLWIPVKGMAQNTPPEVTRIEILPSNPTLDDDLTCSYDYYDADSDPEDISQRFVGWQRNGVWQTEFRDLLTVPSSATGDNEEWEVFLRVHDGTDQSITYRASVTFGTPQPNTPPEVRDMEILPHDPTTSDDLTLSYTYYDADGDPEDESQRFIAWQRNGEWTHVHRELLTIPASDTQTGEVWQCIMSVNDGKDQSEQQWSDPVTIGTNTPPVASNLSLSPSNPSIDDDLTASYTYYDADGNPENGSEIRWYRDTILQSDYNDELTVPASATSNGEEWYFTVRPSDGVNFGNLETSTTVIIEEVLEEITTPDTPVGPDSSYKGARPVFITGGAVSNLGHEVNYQWDWGDGNRSLWEDDGKRSHRFKQKGTFHVRARACCRIHDNVMSEWSESTQITILSCTLNITITPSEAGSVHREPNIFEYDYGENVIMTAVSSGTMYVFDHWSGDISGTNNPEQLTMQGIHNVTAHFRMIDEVVSAPKRINGPNSGKLKQILNFTTDSSFCNFGHEVEYQFDWNDGSQSDWEIGLQSHSYSDTGTYYLKARARCQTHTDVMSEWSETHSVTISTCNLVIKLDPIQAGSVTINPEKAGYNYADSVILTAIADTDWIFTGWSGGYTGNNNPATITMVNDLAITAYFSPIGVAVPHLENCYPPSGASQVPRNTNIKLKVMEPMYGIELNSLQAEVNGTEVVNAGVDVTGGNVFINIEKLGYNIKYNPATEFPENSMVTIHIEFTSANGTSFDSSYAFETGIAMITETKLDTISELGGTVIDTISGIVMNIPPNALEESTEILIAFADALPPLPDSANGIGVAYYFGPPGLKFNKPITLSIPYTQSDLDEAGVDDPMKLSIYYFSITSGKWTLLTNLSADPTISVINCQLNEFCYLTFGKQAETGIINQEFSNNIPYNFVLLQNFPNPFNPETTIQYQLSSSNHVKLEVFNVIGDRIRTLVDTKQSSGSYQVIWDGKNDKGIVSTSGIYFIALSTNNTITFKKAVLMK